MIIVICLSVQIFSCIVVVWPHIKIACCGWSFHRGMCTHAHRHGRTHTYVYLYGERECEKEQWNHIIFKTACVYTTDKCINLHNRHRVYNVILYFWLNNALRRNAVFLEWDILFKPSKPALLSPSLSGPTVIPFSFANKLSLVHLFTPPAQQPCKSVCGFVGGWQEWCLFSAS